MLKLDKDGNLIRTPVLLDCSKDKIIVEQHHKKEVDINNIIKRHGVELIQKTAMLQEKTYLMDDIPTNDFQEAMNIVIKAQTAFESMPSQLRKKFNNNAAEYLDFVQNPDNQDELVNLGLANKKPPPPSPIEVIITNPEAPPAV